MHAGKLEDLFPPERTEGFEENAAGRVEFRTQPQLRPPPLGGLL